MTDRQTDSPGYYVCSNRPHLASAAVRPNNRQTIFIYEGRLTISRPVAVTMQETLMYNDEDNTKSYYVCRS